MRPSPITTRTQPLPRKARCVCLDPAAIRSGLPGVLAGLPDKKGARHIERCDACQVYDSDEAACRAYARAHKGLCCFDSELRVYWIPR